MPKRYTETAKSKWLKSYESGRTERAIAHDAKVDARTIRKGIEEARAKQDAKIARVELVRDALRKHQDGLLAELERIRSAVSLPAINHVVLSWFQDEHSALSEPAAEDKGGKEASKLAGQLPIVPNTMRELLKEHLKHDRLWRLLAQYEKAYTAHIAERAALQRELVRLLKEKTGLKLVDGKGNPTPPYVYSYTAGDLLLKTAFRAAFEKSDADNLEARLARDTVADKSARAVVYPGVRLAEVPDREEECKQSLLDAWRELKKSPTVDRVVSTYHDLEGPWQRTQEAVEQLLLLGLVPGHCEVCGRLGMY